MFSQLELDRLQTIEELQNKYLPFKLGEEQREVLLHILEFIDDLDSFSLTLSGNAGVGKSACVKLIVEYLEENQISYLLAAPTNKASNILSNFTGKETITLHKLLELKPSLDILLLDFKDLKYKSNSVSSGIPYKGIVIVDECSMINDVLYDFIVEKAIERQAKIIFIGDNKQCAPVKENHLSKSFQNGIQLQLTHVYRQSNDNPILSVLNELRYSCKYNFEQIISEQGSIVIYKNWQTFVSKTKKLFVEAVKKSNPNLVKLVAYTNKRIETFNQVLRQCIFEDSLEYHVGEFLTGYDTTVYKNKKYDFGVDIINSEDYIVKYVTPMQKKIGSNIFDGYSLKIHPINPEYIDGEIFILSRNNPENKFSNLANEIECLRLNAIQATQKNKANTYWREYFSLMEMFLTPIDLVYDNRVVRKKSLDYGYCISVHKSQGSSIENVLIDMGNLFTCRNKEDLRQLQYVAMSRTKNNIVMLL